MQSVPFLTGIMCIPLSRLILIISNSYMKISTRNSITICLQCFIRTMSIFKNTTTNAITPYRTLLVTNIQSLDHLFVQVVHNRITMLTHRVRISELNLKLKITIQPALLHTVQSDRLQNYSIQPIYVRSQKNVISCICLSNNKTIF